MKGVVYYIICIHVYIIMSSEVFQTWNIQRTVLPFLFWSHAGFWICCILWNSYTSSPSATNTIQTHCLYLCCNFMMCHFEGILRQQCKYATYGKSCVLTLYMQQSKQADLFLHSSPWRKAKDGWCLPPVWNLRAVIWFPFPVSSLVFLPGPFSCLFFFRKFSNIFC